MRPSVLIRFALTLVAGVGSIASAEPLTDGFGYQGRLLQDGAPPAGPTQARFRLYDALTGGQQVGAEVVRTVTPDGSGVFSVSLDFGPVFSDEARYLEIALADPANPSQSIALSPRSLIAPAPVAQYARSAPVPTLAQVSDDLLSAHPDGYVDLAAGDCFLSGLRLFNDIDRGVILSRPGLASTLDLTVQTSDNLEIRSGDSFSIESTFGGGSIEAATGISVVSGSSKLTITPQRAELQALQIELAAAGSIELESTGVFSLSGGIVQIDGGTTLINGHAFLSTQTLLNGILQVSSNGLKPGGGAWGSLSDARHKKNIVPLRDSLGVFKALRPVSFEYAGASHPLAGAGVFRGFIAQEVRVVLPEWVTEDEDGTLLLTPQGFEALTVDAIQQLDARHREEAARLREEIGDLRLRLERLERAARAAP